MDKTAKRISASSFLSYLADSGYREFIGVPCSYLTPLVNQASIMTGFRYNNATSEGEAVAIASGMALAGKKSVVICQNSGLGNMVNPLTSLNTPFKIPVLLLITWRGKPGLKDEPQHELMGEITPKLLEIMDIKYQVLSQDLKQCQRQLCEAMAEMNRTSKPYAFIIEKDTFYADESMLEETYDPELPTRTDILTQIVQTIPESDLIIATTGKTGRELFTLADRNNHLYCVGSMGYANALATGLAMAQSGRVYVLDGDGAALMHLGNLATIGAKKVSNLVHVIIDNGTYDSTGGQRTISQQVNFSTIAKGCGYRSVYRVESITGFNECINTIDEGPVFIHVRIAPGSPIKLGRPNVAPMNIAARFSNHISTNNNRSMEHNDVE